MNISVTKKTKSSQLVMSCPIKKQWPEQPKGSIEIRFSEDEIKMDKKEFNIDRINGKFHDAVCRIPTYIFNYLENKYENALHDIKQHFTTLSGRYQLLQARYARLVHEKNNSESNALQVAIIADYWKGRCEQIESLSQAIDIKRLSPEEYERYVDWQIMRGGSAALTMKNEGRG